MGTMVIPCLYHSGQFVSSLVNFQTMIVLSGGERSSKERDQVHSHFCTHTNTYTHYAFNLSWANLELIIMSCSLTHSQLLTLHVHTHFLLNHSHVLLFKTNTHTHHRLSAM